MKRKIFALVFVFLLSLSGCSVKNYPTTPAKIDTEYYTINRTDGEYFLTPKNPVNENIASAIFPCYSTIDEMRQSIISGLPVPDSDAELMAQYSLSCMWRLSEIQGEDYTFKICNLDALYDCDLPSGCYLNYVAWQGTTYEFFVRGKLADAEIAYFEEQDYLDDLEQKYTSFLTNERMQINKQVKTKERSATEYYITTPVGNEYKYICYEITKLNKKFLIQEEYCISIHNASPFEGVGEVSSTVPTRITMWGVDESGRDSKPRYFCVQLYDIVERPSKQWLSQFGMSPYEAK